MRCGNIPDEIPESEVMSHPFPRTTFKPEGSDLSNKRAYFLGLLQGMV